MGEYHQKEMSVICISLSYKLVPVREYENGLLTGVKVASSLFAKARRERNCEQAEKIKSTSCHFFACPRGACLITLLLGLTAWKMKGDVYYTG